MPTLVYSPAVEAHIATSSGRIIDVSADLSSGQVQRITNGVSNATLVLMNHGRKYDGVFDTMDRIVIYMRRLSRKLLVFSGYLDSVPYFTAYGQSVQITASCTLKRLQNWLWDEGTASAQALLYQDPIRGDADLAKKVRDLLTQVVNWQSKSIHIGQVPKDWFASLQKIEDKFVAEANAQQAATIIGSDAYINGTTDAPTQSGDQSGPFPGTTLPARSGTCSEFGGGPALYAKYPGLPGNLQVNDYGAQGAMQLTGEIPFQGKVQDPWYCAMRWPYLQYSHGGINPVPGVNVSQAESWWKNRLIQVVNPKTQQSVIVRAADWGPGGVESANARAIDLSPYAMHAIGADTNTYVTIALAPPNSKPGPVGGAGAGLGQALATDATTTDANATDGAKAVKVAQRELGIPYSWGGGGKSGPSLGIKQGASTVGFDCSGLVQYVFFTALGMDLGGDTLAQETHGVEIASTFNDVVKNAQAGDLIFYGPHGATHHVAIAMGDGKMIAAPHTGDVVKEQDIYNDGPIFAKRVVGAAGGTVTPVGNSSSSGTSAAQQAGTATSGPQQAADALFNIWSWISQGPDPLSNILGGERALMNDTPILQTIGSLLTAGMRQFCSAPNGDFIAWFPDYFGHYDTAARVIVRDIEIRRDFGVAKSDSSLKTHFFVTSQAVPGPSSQDISPDNMAQMVGTAGIASVEFPEIMEALFGDIAKTDKRFQGDYILNRYGARAQWEPMANTTGHRQEFFFAVMLFAQNWAQQFAANIPLTFMPEVWPGMLLCLPQYGFQAYVQEVTHRFSMQQGGGFDTDVTVISPSRIGKNGPVQLPLGGPMPSRASAQAGKTKSTKKQPVKKSSKKAVLVKPKGASL